VIRIAYVTPKDTREIQVFVTSWLNTNLTDPYEEATSKTRSNFVVDDDFMFGGTMPKIHFDINKFNPSKIATQGKTDYLEEEAHEFIIYYYNERNRRFAFADNSLTLSNEAQAMKYLQYVRDTLKTNMASFNDYFHKHVFGSISKPKFNPSTKTFIAMMPFTVFTYRR